MSLVVKVLGAGQHVGKSCNIISLNNVNILIDCGIQITKVGRDRFPDLASLIRRIPGSPISRDEDLQNGACMSVDETMTHRPWKRPRLEQMNPEDCQILQQPPQMSGSPQSHRPARPKPLERHAVSFPASSYTWNIDAVLITHFHLDHVGALPYLTEILGYAGPVFMTQPTLELARIVLHDCWCKSGPLRGSGSQQTYPISHFSPHKIIGHSTSHASPSTSAHHETFDSSIRPCCRVTDPPYQANKRPQSSWRSSEKEVPNRRPAASLSSFSPIPFFGDAPLSPHHIEACLSRIQVIHPDDSIQIGATDVRVTAIVAGHVFGAVMFQIEDSLSGNSVLYTGDYTTGSERFFHPAKIPSLRPTVVITESTYGSQIRDSKKSTEQDLCVLAEEAIRRGGKVLIPIGGVGKAQEIAALLDHHWARYRIEAPILISSGMIDEGLAMLKTLDASWSRIQWSALKHVSTADVQTVLQQYASQPIVYLSPPKTLDSGASFEVLKVWADNPNNLILLPSYSLPGTIAYQILNGQRLLRVPHRGMTLASSSTALEFTIHLKAAFRYLSIGSHSDAIAVQSFLKYTAPLVAVLVHGELNGMKQLSANLRRLLGCPVHHPENDEVIIVQLPGIPAQPTRIRTLYQDLYMTKVMRNISETNNENNESSAATSLEALLDKNLASSGGWIAQREKEATTGVLTRTRALETQCSLLKPNLRTLIDEWCPNLASVLQLPAFMEDVNCLSVTPIVEILMREQPWILEEMDKDRPNSRAQLELRGGTRKQNRQKRKRVKELGKRLTASRSLGKKQQKHQKQRRAETLLRDPTVRIISREPIANDSRQRGVIEDRITNVLDDEAEFIEEELIEEGELVSNNFDEAELIEEELIEEGELVSDNLDGYHCRVNV